MLSAFARVPRRLENVIQDGESRREHNQLRIALAHLGERAHVVNVLSCKLCEFENNLCNASVVNQPQGWRGFKVAKRACRLRIRVFVYGLP